MYDARCTDSRRTDSRRADDSSCLFARDRDGDAGIGRPSQKASALAHALYRCEKAPQLHPVQFAISAHAGTQVEPEWSHGFDCFGCVFGREPSSKKQRDVNAFADGAAQAPIVISARPPEFLHSKFLVAGVEQDCIHVRQDAHGFFDRLGAGYVEDLYDFDAGKTILQIAMRANGEMIANLNRIGATEVLLLDDAGNALA
jgi:hypothetical protein